MINSKRSNLIFFGNEENIRAKKVTSTETRYFIDKYLEISNNEVIRHIHWNDMKIATIDKNNVIVFNHEDHQGSSIARTDAAGAVVKNKSYYPFGETRIDSGSYAKTNHNYTSQYEDVESGLYYYKRRYYNPVLGRFLSADPLYAEEIDERGINTQEINLYAYVGNNPVNRVDPSGKKTRVIVTYDKILGIKYASHVAAQVDNGGDGQPALYDPSGSYERASGQRGTSGVLTGKQAQTSSFVDYHKKTGSSVRVFTVDTTPAQEAKLIEAAVNQGDKGVASCADDVSSVLPEIEPFKDLVTPSITPGGVADDVSKVPGVKVDDF